MKKFLKYLLPAFLMAATVLLHADIASAATADEESFLDPAEAYQPKVSIKDSTLIVDWHIEKGYFLYRHGFKLLIQQANDSTNLQFSQDDGHKKYDEYFEKDVEIYHNTTQMRANIEPYIGSAFNIKITSQGCADAGLCFPPTDTYFKADTLSRISQSTADYENVSTAQNPTITASSDTSLTQIILTIFGAFLGGFILNLMPCVFPVLSLKALSFSSAHTSPKAQHQHGWAYTAGVVGSFVLAAVIILVARSAGESLGWGFQLQHPIFVTLMIYLFFVMGLSLSGFFEFGGGFMGIGQNLTTGNNLKSSFFTGVLAALVASPCTAPFMATALGVALTQPIFISLIIFVALGFGMAFPFLLLSYSPKLARLMPKPGAWMTHFRQALAFPLFLTSIWLLWVLSHQTSHNTLIMALIGMLLITLSLWVLKLPSRSKKSQFAIKTIALIFLLPAGFIAYDAKSTEQVSTTKASEVFSLVRLDNHRKNGTPVLVDLTADWCLTCKVNESIAFTDNVRSRLKESGVELLIGDWTNQNPDIEVLLKQHQRSGIPLYLMYPKGGGEPEMLPQLLTETIVINAIKRSLL